MTVRNATAKLGWLTAFALTLLVVAVFAGSPSLSSPAAAQSVQEAEEIWSATLTVGSVSNAKGYASPNVGALTDPDFSLGSDNVVIRALVESPSPSRDLKIALDTELDASQMAALRLHIDGVAFLFAFATYSTDATGSHIYTWTAPSNFGWKNGQTIAVSINALPIITVEAVTSQVEHKGIAEFRFNRTGSTNEGLTFNLQFAETGESVTTRFKSGKSTLTLKHWATETDSSDNPVCTITWSVTTGKGFVPGTPSVAMVDVEGPGAICT